MVKEKTVDSLLGEETVALSGDTYSLIMAMPTTPPGLTPTPWKNLLAM
jgi:hypothetical protein